MSAYSPTQPVEHSSLAAWMAWRRYLTTIRAAAGDVYGIVEDSAWKRLCEELADAGRPLTEDEPVRLIT
jgi:hypothetical protein